jgi:hypothetical protein
MRDNDPLARRCQQGWVGEGMAMEVEIRRLVESNALTRLGTAAGGRGLRRRCCAIHDETVVELQHCCVAWIAEKRREFAPSLGCSGVTKPPSVLSTWSASSFRGPPRRANLRQRSAWPPAAAVWASSSNSRVQAP